MRFFQHQTEFVSNSTGAVRKTFKVVKGDGEKMVKVEGVSNKNDSSLFHILQTLRKNHMVARRYYQIHEDDIMNLLKEGERKGDLEKMRNYQGKKSSLQVKSLKKKSSIKGKDSKKKRSVKSKDSKKKSSVKKSVKSKKVKSKK